jgi:DNA-directed RNA polymerase subunit beta'
MEPGDLLATWDPFTTPIITEVAGSVKFGDIIPGKTMQEKVDPVTGKSSRTDHPSRRAARSGRAFPSRTKTARPPSCPGQWHGPLHVAGEAIFMVEEGDNVRPAMSSPSCRGPPPKPRTSPVVCPAWPSFSRCASPKRRPYLSEIDGYVSIAKGTKKGKQKVTITRWTSAKERIPHSPRQAHQRLRGRLRARRRTADRRLRRSPGYPQHQG